MGNLVKYVSLYYGAFDSPKKKFQVFCRLWSLFCWAGKPELVKRRKRTEEKEGETTRERGKRGGELAQAFFNAKKIPYTTIGGKPNDWPLSLGVGEGSGRREHFIGREKAWGKKARAKKRLSHGVTMHHGLSQKNSAAEKIHFSAAWTFCISLAWPTSRFLWEKDCCPSSSSLRSIFSHVTASPPPLPPLCKKRLRRRRERDNADKKRRRRRRRQMGQKTMATRTAMPNGQGEGV